MRLGMDSASPEGADSPVKNRPGTSGILRAARKGESMSQNQRVLQHMMKWGSITAREAYECYGIMRLGARIDDLKRIGYKIHSSMEQGENRYGELTRYARYRLQI